MLQQLQGIFCFKQFKKVIVSIFSSFMTFLFTSLLPFRWKYIFWRNSPILIITILYPNASDVMFQVLLYNIWICECLYILRCAYALSQTREVKINFFLSHFSFQCLKWALTELGTQGFHYVSCRMSPRDVPSLSMLKWQMHAPRAGFSWVLQIESGSSCLCGK